MNDKYREYLNSAEWKDKCRRVRKRAKGQCEECGHRRIDHIHHKTYRRIFREQMEDLLGLCAPCHRSKHPDKPEEPFTFLVRDAPCKLCPTGRAELYVSPTELVFVCVGCGNAVLRKRRRQVERRRKAASVRRKKGRRCRHCGRKFDAYRGLMAHTEAKHTEYAGLVAPKERIRPPKVRVAGKRQKRGKQRKAPSFEDAAAAAQKRILAELKRRGGDG